MPVVQIMHSIIRSERRCAGRYAYWLYYPSGLDIEAWGGSSELVCLRVSGPDLVPTWSRLGPDLVPTWSVAGQIAGTKKPAVKLALVGLLGRYTDGSIRLESQKNAAMNSMAPIALYISYFTRIFRPIDLPWLVLFRHKFASVYAGGPATVQGYFVRLVSGYPNSRALAYPSPW